METYSAVTKRPIAPAAFSNAAKVAWNSRVAGLKDTFGVKKEDVKPLILWVLLNAENPTIYSRIDSIFTHYNEFVEWKRDYRADIAADGIIKTILKSRFNPDEAPLDKEIEEAFFL